MSDLKSEVFIGNVYPLGIQPLSQDFFVLQTPEGERVFTGRMVTTTFTPKYPPDLTDEMITLGGG